MNYETHPAADLFPLLKGAEYESLKKDIAENGLLEPIWLCEGKILDGRNRYNVCLELGIDPETREYDGDLSPIAFAWSLNGLRRHLSPSQLAAIAVKMLPPLQEEAIKRRDQAPGKPRGTKSSDGINLAHQRSAEQAAEIVGIGHANVNRAARVQREDPELFKKIEAGEITVNKALQIVKDRGPQTSKSGPKPRQKEKHQARIRALAEQGYRASQIADDVGLDERTVKLYARQAKITLPDVVIGARRKIKANRVIEEMVNGLEGYALGLTTINGLDEISKDSAREWAESIAESLKSINTVLKQLREVANG